MTALKLKARVTFTSPCLLQLWSDSGGKCLGWGMGWGRKSIVKVLLKFNELKDSYTTEMAFWKNT